MTHDEARRWFRHGKGPPLSGPKPFGLVARGAVIAALGLFLIGKANPAAVEPLRETVVVPFSAALALTAGLVRTVVIETRSLIATPVSETGRADETAMAARLAALEHENAALRKLVPMAGSREYKISSVAVIGGSSTGAGSAVLIAAGRDHGMKPGYPAMMGDRVLGRVHHVHSSTAIVRRLSDRLSRVPVMVGAAQTRAILAGSGDGAASLELIGQGPAPAVGDHVTTSGIGGVFPRGLIIGSVAAASQGSARVSIDSEAAYESVVGVMAIEGAVFDNLEAGGSAHAARAASTPFKQAGRNTAPPSSDRQEAVP